MLQNCPACPEGYKTVSLDDQITPVIFISSDSFLQVRRAMHKERKKNRSYSPIT
jgi:hypothetical protein